MKITDKELREASPKKRKKLLGQLVEAARHPVSAQDILEFEIQIKEFEVNHQMTSDEMKTRLSNGEIQETWDICRWLMDLKRLERMKARSK